jgi:GrpB-like predicted nucleotidyltransferase (UPF0157 family)
MSDRIVLATYDPAWPEQFEAARALLEQVLRPWLEGGIHHIGSTAIPNMRAKPVIDMMAGVRDLEEARAAFEPLGRHGYVFAPHRPHEAHHFDKPSPRLSEATHGLHLTRPGSDLWRERLAFRDALRSDATLRAEYEALKLRLAEDGAGYTRAKRPFVAQVLAKARNMLEPYR